jgi:hypothetical protein
LPAAIAIDNFEALDYSWPILNVDFTWPRDHMIQALKSYFHKVILGIVSNAAQREPFGLDLSAEGQRSDLDLRLLALEEFRDAIEELAPLLLVELAGRHDGPPVGQSCTSSLLAPVLIANKPIHGAERQDRRRQGQDLCRIRSRQIDDHQLADDGEQ